MRISALHRAHNTLENFTATGRALFYFFAALLIFSTVGLGATISRATDSGNFNLLIASTIVMAAVVVAINRTVWRRLYVLAETRYKLEL